MSEGKLQSFVAIIGIIALFILPEIGITILALVAAWALLCKALTPPSE